MEQFSSTLELWTDKIKPYCTRKNAEIASLSLIILCAASLILGQISFQKTLTYDNGNITYTGSLKSNKMTGKGTLTFKNGDRYKGEFKNGIFHGQGTFTAKEGWTYVGEFKQGQPDGQGKLTTKEKTVYEGTFKQGIYQHED
ncbi:MORN repeat-containing protein [Streptococcus cameli]